MDGTHIIQATYEHERIADICRRLGKKQVHADIIEFLHVGGSHGSQCGAQAHDQYVGLCKTLTLRK